MLVCVWKTVGTVCVCQAMSGYVYVGLCGLHAMQDNACVHTCFSLCVFCWYVYGKQAVMVNNPTGSAIEFITSCIPYTYLQPACNT